MSFSLPMATKPRYIIGSAREYHKDLSDVIKGEKKISFKSCLRNTKRFFFFTVVNCCLVAFDRVRDSRTHVVQRNEKSKREALVSWAGSLKYFKHL